MGSRRRGGAQHQRAAGQSGRKRARAAQSEDSEQASRSGSASEDEEHQQGRRRSATATHVTPDVLLEPPQDEILLPTLGARARHRVLDVTGVVAQLPSIADFLHKGKVLLRYGAVEKKVPVVKSIWCSPAELELMRSSPRKQAAHVDTVNNSPVRIRQPQSSQVSARPFEHVVCEEEAVAERAAERPELAAHERGRVIPEKSIRLPDGEPRKDRTKWGALGAHKTGQTKVLCCAYTGV